MNLYYYKCLQGNFGDDINAWLWKELAPGIWERSSEISVSGIGTILGEDMPFSPRWIIMSSGTGYAPLSEDVHRADWNVICVRGPLTARVLGLPADKAVTDGAILVSLLPAYQPVEVSKRDGVVFMPHHGQTLKLGRWKEACVRAGIEFLDPRGDSKYLLERIGNAKFVLAGAMHAAILADALRVPWLPLEISAETSSFKWLDWCLSMEVSYKPAILPTSSFLEYLHSKVLLALKLNHTFSDLTIEGAMRHVTMIHERENYGAEIKRNIVGKSFGFFRSATQQPVLKSLYAWFDRDRVTQAAHALERATECPPMLSRDDVFQKKKEEMSRCLEVLKVCAMGNIVSDLKPNPATEHMRFYASLRRRVFTDHALNTLLRFSSLVAKLGLTLYMGRYLGLAEMGTYGLITAYVAVLVTLLGVRFDYIVSRDIVDAQPFNIACKIRDQSVFYALNYLALAILVALVFVGPLKNVNPGIIFFTFILSVLESFAAITSGNFVSLKKPVLANMLFFIRAALWVAPVIVLGVISPVFRTAEMVLYCWSGGVIASLAVTFLAWRHLPWRQAFRAPIDWGWVKNGVIKCFPIWLGVIGGTAATYVDRFVVEHYLGLEYVGITSFYGSFVLAIQSLLQSGIFAFSYPRLISYHKRGQGHLFRREVRKTTLQATLFAGFMSLAIGAVVPLMGSFFHRPEFTTYAPVLWLMLVGVWIRSTTEGLYYVLYARHQDRIIWIGGLLMLIPACACNMLLVPYLGFVGIGYSAIAVALFLGGWRIYCVTRRSSSQRQNLVVKEFRQFD